MARTSRKTIVAAVVAQMNSLGLYRPEFDDTISIYVDTLIDYRKQLAALKKQGGLCYVPTAQGMKKSPIVTTIESDRKDLLAYAEALGLTPRANKKIMEGQLTGKTDEPESGDAVTARLEALLYGGGRDDE